MRSLIAGMSSARIGPEPNERNCCSNLSTGGSSFILLSSAMSDVSMPVVFSSSATIPPVVVIWSVLRDQWGTTEAGASSTESSTAPLRLMARSSVPR